MCGMTEAIPGKTCIIGFMDIQLDVTYENVLQTVRDWPQANQLSLVQDILNTLSQELRDSQRGRGRKTAHLALGLLAMSQGVTPPTDKEVSELLEEHRLRKYGS
jgi:hypothetical protein